MPTPALLLLIATLLPLVSFVLLVFLGKRLGSPLAGIVGTMFILASFVLSMVAMTYWMQAEKGPEAWGYNNRPILQTYGWIPTGPGMGQAHPGYLDVGVYVDSLTIAMFSMVTLVATLVHVFSIGYMSQDKRFGRFFTYLGLFCFSMLGLVISGTVLQLFIFWELVGLCSYLLIGFWYEKKSASNAAIKAFVTNRVGDFGFLIGFGILFYHLGNTTLPELWRILGPAASTGTAVTLPGGLVFGTFGLTVMGIGLFFGAIGKSAQFPLHVWLPDAMEGPTPVSALIHAATMVAAGVYLVGRIFPILTPDARLFIAVIGCTTLTMAALIALAQTDIKKVLAYSTLSQLGYMILAMGIGSWVGALFHLITHAFFKALLFLGSGSVIHAAHHEQELPQYGGLLKRIPVTALTFFVAVLAISGFSVAGWGFSGFYSKDLILTHAAAFGFLSDHSPLGRHAYWIFFWAPTIVAYLTAFYMMRCWTLTFWGKPRNQHLHDHAHESPILYFPLIILAGASIVGGKYMNVKEMIEAAQVEIANIVSPEVFSQAWSTKSEEKSMIEAEAPVEVAPVAQKLSPSEEALEHGEHLMHKSVGFAWLVGIGLAFLIYMKGYAVTDVLMRIPPVRWINVWLKNRMYFDELYGQVFIGVTLAVSAVAAAFDKYVVDGLVNGAAGMVRGLSKLTGLNDKYVVDGAVNGVGKVAWSFGNSVRNPESGRIRLYMTSLMAVVMLGIAAAILVVLSR